MSFSSPEKSVANSQPIETYAFRTTTTAHFYTNAENEISDGSNTYTPAQITRTQPVLANDRRSTNLELTLSYLDDAVDEFAQLYITNPTEGRTTLVIQRMHLTDAGSTFVTFWEGAIISAAYDEDGNVKMLCKGVKNIFAREGPRMVWGASCQHTLYDNNCALLEDDFTTFNVQVTGIVRGTILTLSGLPSPTPNYVGGKVTKENGADFRLVVAQSGNVITLQQPFRADFAVGDLIDIARGCSHNLDATDGCPSFNNVINYGGAPYTPGLNPFVEGLDKL